MIAPLEWQQLAGLIEEWWPGEFDEPKANAWRIALDDFDAAEVLGALKMLLARGGTFRPSVAELIGEIRRDPTKPTFEEAYQLIYGPRGVMRATPRPGGRYDNEAAMLKARNDARLERAQQLHPLVAEFVYRYGVDRLSRLEVDDPDYGQLRLKDLRDAWDRHCEAMEGRDVAELVAGQAGRLRGLGRFDPLRALPASGRRSSGAELALVDREAV